MSEQQAQQLDPEEREAMDLAVLHAVDHPGEQPYGEWVWCAARDFYLAARVAGCPDEGRRDVTEGASVPLTVSEALVLYDALTGRDVGIQRNEHYLTGFRKLHEARLRLSPQMGTGA